jgi:transcriptional regulator with XRE-family HTH domain
MSEPFGEKLKRLRTTRNISQRYLAKKAQTTQSYITSLENSKVSNPSHDVIRRLALALNISIEELTGESGGKLPTHIENFAFWLANKNVDEPTLANIAKIVEIYITSVQMSDHLESSDTIDKDITTVVAEESSVPQVGQEQYNELQTIIEQLRHNIQTSSSLLDLLTDKLKQPEQN